MTPRHLGIGLGLVGVLPTGGCITLRIMAPDLPCREAAVAIASRTERCTGDIELANTRYEAFEDTYECIAVEVGDPAFDGPALSPDDVFDCARAIRDMPCELVETYGDDLDRWLMVSNACPWVVARRDGLPIGLNSPEPTPTTDSTPTPYPTTDPIEPDPPETCVRTSGSPDRLVADGALLPYGGSARTIELWLRTEPGEDAPMVAVAYGDGGYTTTLQVGVLYGQAVAEWGGLSLQSASPVNDGELHHVAFTYDGFQGVLYVDGLREISYPVSLDTVEASPLILGNSVEGGPDLGFLGWLGDVRLWDVALSEAELEAVIEGPVDPDAPGLLRWYAMDVATGATTVVPNSGGNRGGNATIEGAPSFEACEP